MNVTESIFSNISSQGCSALFLKGNLTFNTANRGSHDGSAHRWVRPQLREFETLPRTLEILSPTVRMEAIAATAISEAINVYSTAVAPRLSLINWRKMDSILISKTPARAKVCPTDVLRSGFKNRT
jgi:hypothetical protein